MKQLCIEHDKYPRNLEQSEQKRDLFKQLHKMLEQVKTDSDFDFFFLQ